MYFFSFFISPLVLISLNQDNRKKQRSYTIHKFDRPWVIKSNPLKPRISHNCFCYSCQTWSRLLSPLPFHLRMNLLRFPSSWMTSYSCWMWLKQYLYIKYAVSTIHNGPCQRTFEDTYWFQEHDKIYWQDKELCHYPQHVKQTQSHRALK